MTSGNKVKVTASVVYGDGTSDVTTVTPGAHRFTATRPYFGLLHDLEAADAAGHERVVVYLPAFTPNSGNDSIAAIGEAIGIILRLFVDSKPSSIRSIELVSGGNPVDFSLILNQLNPELHP